MSTDWKLRWSVAYYYLCGMEDYADKVDRNHNESRFYGVMAYPFAGWFATHATRFAPWEISGAFKHFTAPVSLTKVS
jgi:hypothetical protein